jgi:hypothetical protein
MSIESATPKGVKLVKSSVLSTIYRGQNKQCSSLVRAFSKKNMGAILAETAFTKINIRFSWIKRTILILLWVNPVRYQN